VSFHYRYSTTGSRSTHCASCILLLANMPPKRTRPDRFPRVFDDATYLSHLDAVEAKKAATIAVELDAGTRWKRVATDLRAMETRGIIRSIPGAGRYNKPAYLLLDSATPPAPPIFSVSHLSPQPTSHSAPPLPASPLNVRPPDPQYSDQLIDNSSPPRPVTPLSPVDLRSDSDGDHTVSPQRGQTTSAQQRNSESHLWAGTKRNEEHEAILAAIPDDVQRVTCHLCKEAMVPPLLLFMPCLHQNVCANCWPRAQSRQISVQRTQHRLTSVLANPGPFVAKPTHCPNCHKVVVDAIKPFV
jgi:hypothetical protein